MLIVGTGYLCYHPCSGPFCGCSTPAAHHHTDVPTSWDPSTSWLPQGVAGVGVHEEGARLPCTARIVLGVYPCAQGRTRSCVSVHASPHSDAPCGLGAIAPSESTRGHEHYLLCFRTQCRGRDRPDDKDKKKKKPENCLIQKPKKVQNPFGPGWGRLNFIQRQQNRRRSRLTLESGDPVWTLAEQGLGVRQEFERSWGRVGIGQILVQCPWCSSILTLWFPFKGWSFWYHTIFLAHWGIWQKNRLLTNY